MPAPGRKRALTAVLPVQAGFGEPLALLLAASAATVRGKLRSVPSLHFARCALLGPPGAPSELLFATTFDDEAAAHLAELWQHAGPELAAIFSHCSGWRAPATLDDFTRFLERGACPSAALFTAFDALGVERVRDDARLRRELARFLDAHATELRELSPLEIGTRAQTELGVAKASVTAPSGRSPRERPRLAVAAWAGLTLTGLRAALADVIDFVRELWLDTSVRLERAPGAGSTAPLGAQRCFSHVARVKPGRFRRAALRLALRALAALSFAATAAGGSEGTRSILAARWVLLDDGRLVFLANHDGSLRAALGAFALRASALVGMVWSQTLGFPRSFGWFAGGARDELGLAAFAAAGELSTPLWYSAYPELGADEMRANAEIRALLAGDLDAPGAARLLALVRD